MEGQSKSLIQNAYPIHLSTGIPPGRPQAHVKHTAGTHVYKQQKNTSGAPSERSRAENNAAGRVVVYGSKEKYLLECVTGNAFYDFLPALPPVVRVRMILVSPLRIS